MRLNKLISEFRPLRLLLIAALIGMAALHVKPARAASITVNTTSDALNSTDGKCSLREAIRAANNNMSSGIVVGECPAGSSGGADTINLVNGAVYSLTNGNAGALDILNNTASLDVVLNVPPGFAATISQNASPDSRVLTVRSGANVEVYGVTFKNGGNVNSGAGILNQGTLVLTNSRVSNNSANVSGGGIFNEGTLTLNNSIVNQNNAPFGKAGGILSSGTLTTIGSLISDNLAADLGGGILNSGSATLDSSTVSGNTGSNGGGIYNDEDAAMEIRNGSVIEENTGAGSGVWQDGNGGAIRNAVDATLTITDSRIANNHVIGFGGALQNSGDAFIEFSTISGNSATASGGAFEQSLYGTLTVSTSSIVNNEAGLKGGAVYIGSEIAYSVSITSSCIAGNSSGLGHYDFHNSGYLQGPQLQNASGNWWGANDGPSGVGSGSGDSVSADVYFGGFATSPLPPCLR